MNIEQYRKRFFNLMESTIGDAKPLINEEKRESGKLKFPDGVYNGEFYRSGLLGEKIILDGFGTYDWDNSREMYKGYWKNHKREGYGTQIYSNGSKYVGDWKNHKREGYGTYTQENGLRYVGNWKNDVYNGYGSQQNPDTSKYVGDWYNGAMNGYGTLTDDLRKEKYVGQWVNNMRNGYGTQTYADGSVKKGTWKNNELVTTNNTKSDNKQAG